MNKAILLLFLFLSLCVFCECNIPFLSPPPPFRFGGMQTFACTNFIKYNENLLISKNKIEVNGYDILKIFILGSGLSALLSLLFLIYVVKLDMSDSILT